MEKDSPSCSSMELNSSAHNASWRPDNYTNPPIETIGAVCELETESDCEEIVYIRHSSSEAAQLVFNDHNYAKPIDHIPNEAGVNRSRRSSVTQTKRNLEVDVEKSATCHSVEPQNENNLPNKKLRVEDSVQTSEGLSCESKSCKGSPPEKLTVSTPIRRSRRQIEKIERKQFEKDIASCIDAAISETFTDKTEKTCDKKEDVSSTDLTSGLNTVKEESKNSKSDLKTLPELKKRHVQIILFDCLKDGTVKDKNIRILQPNQLTIKGKCHDLTGSALEKNSTCVKPVSDSSESTDNFEKMETIPIKDEKMVAAQELKDENNVPKTLVNKDQSSCTQTVEKVQGTEEMKSDDKLLLEKSSMESQSVENKVSGPVSSLSSIADVNSEKIPPSQQKQSSIQTNKSKRLVHKMWGKKMAHKGIKAKVIKKIVNAKSMKDTKCEKSVTKSNQNSQKSAANSKSVSQNNSSTVGLKQNKSPKVGPKVANKSSGRKKSFDSQQTGSTSDVSEVQPSSMDIKVSDDKLTSSSVVAKVNKKKVIKKEVTRLPLNENEPALFSTPDVLVKIKTDENSPVEISPNNPKSEVSTPVKTTPGDTNVMKSVKLFTDQNFNSVKSLKPELENIRVEPLERNDESTNQKIGEHVQNQEPASIIKSPCDIVKQNTIEKICNKGDNDSTNLSETKIDSSSLKQKFEDTNLGKTEEILKCPKQNLVSNNSTASQSVLLNKSSNEYHKNTSPLDSNTVVLEPISDNKSICQTNSSSLNDNSLVLKKKESIISIKNQGNSNEDSPLEEANVELMNQDEKNCPTEQLKVLPIVHKTGKCENRLNSSNLKEDNKPARLNSPNVKEDQEPARLNSSNVKEEQKPIRKSVRERKVTKKIIQLDTNDDDEDSEAMSESEDDSYEEDDPEKLWCICRKPHNSRFMIQCDKCEDWFHGSCVGITKQLGRQLEKQKKEWHCPNCMQKDIPKVAAKSPSEKMNSSFKKNQVPEKKLNINRRKSQELQASKVESPGSCKSNPVLSSPAVIQGQSSKVSAETLVKKTNLSPVTTRIVKIIKAPSESPDKLSKQSVVKKAIKISGKNIVVLKESRVMKDTLGSMNDSPSNSSAKPSAVNGKKNISTPKEKKSFRKRISCTNCKLEAMPNSCYCSNQCLEQYTEKCLNDMRLSNAGLKNSDFENQRLVVLDRLRGSVITSEHGPTVKEIVSWLKVHPSYMITNSSSSGPNAKKEALQKKDNSNVGKISDTNSNTARKSDGGNSEKSDKKPDDEEAKATVRLNVRKTLKNILFERCKNSDDIQMPEDDIEKIANKIEKELQHLFKDNSFKYRAKYRSLMFNIKDPRNQGLFRKILTGVIQPDRLVKMSPEELASLELARWREQENQHVLDMIKRVQLEHQSMSGSLLKKTHKGEVEIETLTETFVEKDVPKISTKETSEDCEPEKDVTKDTTPLHRSHLFDLNCKICTGKVVPPPDESSCKRVRVAHSISVDVSSSNSSDAIEKSDKPQSKTDDSNGDDSVDQEPSSTVSIGSPDSNTKSHSRANKVKALSVWKGFIIMQDVAKFVTTAYKVSGRTDHLQSDLPDIIQVCGRIIPDQVWEYLGKIKQSGNKELIVIRFQPANEEETNAYNSFYSYLSTRKRYGVVSNFSKKIKDFYILPLAATSPVPMVLVPFDGPGLPSPRPPLLLGVIVKHKQKQASVPVQTKPLVKKVELESSDASYTPPHEPRSYTPPLPALPVSDNKVDIQKNLQSLEAMSSRSSLGNASEDDHSNSLQMENVSLIDSTIEKDDDKPYDPEQDIPCIPSGGDDKEASVPDTPTSDNLEDQKKILDALTRQVEETDRVVNALKQLISEPEEDDIVANSNVPPLDINTIAGSGMSSFLDLPETLQDIFNNVRLKSHEKDTSFEADKRLGTDKSQTEQNQMLQVLNIPDVNRTENKLSSQSTPPPSTDDKDRNCVSDPRIKLRTNFQDAFSSSGNLSPSQSKSPSSDDESPISLQLSTTWNSGEPAPPGLETCDLSPPRNSVYSTVPETTSVNFGTNFLGPRAEYPPPPFQPQLPPGFSVHKPPPPIKHFPPPQIISPSYPPPMPVPVLPPSSKIVDNQVPDSWHSLPPPKLPVSHNRWEKSSDTSQYYSSEDTTNYQSQGENVYASHSDSKHWGPSRYSSSKWNKNSSRHSRRDNHRGHGRRGNGPYHRNARN